jgi:hypothetical protein
MENRKRHQMGADLAHVEAIETLNPQQEEGRQGADLAHGEACYIERGDRLDKAHGVLAAPADRAHMRDIKKTGLLADLRVIDSPHLSAHVVVKGTCGSQ